VPDRLLRYDSKILISMYKKKDKKGKKNMANAPLGRGDRLFDRHVSEIIGEEIKLEDRWRRELVSKVYNNAEDVEDKVKIIISALNLTRDTDISITKSLRFPGYRIIFNRKNIGSIINQLEQDSPRDSSMDSLERYFSSLLECDIKIELSRGSWVSGRYASRGGAEEDMKTLVSKESRLSLNENIGVAESLNFPGQFRIVINYLDNDIISIANDVAR
jgi:hypothetical protein